MTPRRWVVVGILVLAAIFALQGGTYTTFDLLRLKRDLRTEREMIDQRVEKVAPQWPPRRQPAVDRNLIRQAVWELTNSDTPPKVVIDEAIEMAKKFSTEQSPAFINGVLDAVLKEHLGLTEGTGGAEGKQEVE